MFEHLDSGIYTSIIMLDESTFIFRHVFIEGGKAFFKKGKREIKPGMRFSVNVIDREYMDFLLISSLTTDSESLVAYHHGTPYLKDAKIYLFCRVERVNEWVGAVIEEQIVRDNLPSLEQEYESMLKRFVPPSPAEDEFSEFLPEEEP